MNREIRLTHWRIIDRQRGRTLPRRFDSREGAEIIITAAGRQGDWEATEHNATGKRVCDHQWVMGDDACQFCGESWADRNLGESA